MIRTLERMADHPLVARFYRDAPDYWMMADGAAPDAAKVDAFFTDCPPGCDPARSERLGLFLEGRLSGLVELAFGFPGPKDAYVGLMLLGPWAQGMGHGARLLHEVERRAVRGGAVAIYLGVLSQNTRGRNFWQREGFTDTGLCGTDPDTGHVLHRLGKGL
jgi:ribosomal protein S18 acetylase RimI-like enzyme